MREKGKNKWMKVKISGFSSPAAVFTLSGIDGVFPS